MRMIETYTKYNISAKDLGLDGDEIKFVLKVEDAQKHRHFSYQLFKVRWCQEGVPRTSILYSEGFIGPHGNGNMKFYHYDEECSGRTDIRLDAYFGFDDIDEVVEHSKVVMRLSDLAGEFYQKEEAE